MATILVGHVTKDGSVAGPRVLEHLVDCVLQFEGDRYHAHRVLRAVKNRFGSTNELGVFEMTGAGLVGVPDPSEVFGRTTPGEPGAAVACALEGTRPILLEIQALVAQSELAMPRRVATGIDPKRLAMIVAVLSRHARVALGQADVFVNVAGGVRIDEPGADLAVALAIASAARRVPVKTRRRCIRRDRPHGTAAPGRAGRAKARGVREARSLGRGRAGRHTRRMAKSRSRPQRRCGRRSRRGWMATDPKERLSAGVRASPRRSRLHAHPRRRKTRAARTRSSSPRSQKIAPGTGLREAVDDVIRSHEGALIVVGDPGELSFLYSGGIRLDAPFRPQLLYELAKMDGAIIVDEAVKRLAWANVQLMPDPTIPSNETGTRHRTAERVAKQTGALVVSVSQQRETVTIFVGPARYQLDPGRGRPREDEPGARHARHVPAAARAGADAADGARVPERRRARRRPRRPPARRDDHADGRSGSTRDCIELGSRGPADQAPARGARRRGAAGARRDRPRLPRPRRRRRGDGVARAACGAPVPGAARVRAARRGARLRPRDQPARPGRRAARLPDALAHPAPARAAGRAGSCPTSAASTRSCAPRSASSSRSRESARCARARSARACAGCRSTTSWIATCSSSAKQF